MSNDFVKLTEFARRIDKPLGSVYHLSRRDAIPGMVRVSARSVRVHWPTYLAAATQQHAPAA